MSMTARQVYEGVLVEMNKVQAPSMLLEDFNYFINKAINQYINKKYNVYDVNQQATDDLRVLKATEVLKVTKTTKYGPANEAGDVISRNSIFGATYEAYLPEDYLHMLNCICNYKVKKQFKCYDPNTYVQFGATRLTADLWGQILNNFYMKPSYKKPYYYLHNVNPVVAQSADESDVASHAHVPTNEYNSSSNPTGTDMGTTPYRVQPAAAAATDVYAPATSYKSGTTYYTLNANGSGYTAVTGTGDAGAVTQNDFNTRTVAWYIKGTTTAGDPYVVGQTGTSNLPRTFTFSDNKIASLVEKPTAQRIANPSQVRIEIRAGKDSSIFDLQTIYIDYIKAPQNIRLTQEQIDLTEDTSQMMEFPDYVCQEIINELTHLIMENSSDPRLQSHMPISMSIANPAQQQTSESK